MDSEGWKKTKSNKLNSEKEERGGREQWKRGLQGCPKTRSPASSPAHPPPPVAGHPPAAPASHLHRRPGRRWTAPSGCRWRRRRATLGASSCGVSRASPSSGPSTAATSGPSSARRPHPRPPPSAPSALVRLRPLLPLLLPSLRSPVKDLIFHNARCDALRV